MLQFAAVLALGAPASAEDLCGRGDAKIGTAELEVHIYGETNPAERPYVRLQVPGTGPFIIDATYRPEGDKIGRPGVASLRAKVPPGTNRFYQLEWREAGAKNWFNEGYRFEPRFYAGEPLGSVDTRMGQGPPLAFRSEVLEALARGASFEVRSLTDDGTVVESGTVSFPAPAELSKAYAAARAQAMKSLAACAPPLILRPAPRP